MRGGQTEGAWDRWLLQHQETGPARAPQQRGHGALMESREGWLSSHAESEARGVGWGWVLGSELLIEPCVCRLWTGLKGGKRGCREVGQDAAMTVRRRDDGGLD